MLMMQNKQIIIIIIIISFHLHSFSVNFSLPASMSFIPNYTSICIELEIPSFNLELSNKCDEHACNGHQEKSNQQQQQQQPPENKVKIYSIQLFSDVNLFANVKDNKHTHTHIYIRL